jgi:hypothetical protein
MRIFPSLLPPVLLVVATLSTAPAVTQVSGTPKPTAPHLLVPAYFYPAGDGAMHWKRLLASASQAPIVAVVNPASGPGKKTDANYLKVFTQAKKTKITLIGYVSTSYGKRSLKDVQADVDQWKRLYPGVTGIFFDEQASSEDLVDYYIALPDHVAVLSYNVPAARDMQACIGAAVEKKIGYLYITDGSGANPWAALPKYWEAEVEAVGNRRKE